MLLGIDVGTSPVKAMLFDPGRGTSVGLAREPLRLAAPDERQAELDPGHLWEVLCTVLGRLRSGHRRAWDGLRGVGLSVIFPALVPMDAAGNPLRGAILYCDRRSLPQVVRLQHEARAEEVEALTGNRLTPGTTTLPVLLWLREHEAEVFERAACFGQLSTYLVHRLTGEWVLDSTHGSLSGLCRSGLETAWYGPLLDIAGIGPERLPVLQAADTAAGLTGGRAAGECGLRPGIPVAAGSGDAPLAAFTG
ncbi:MAG: hypothetical protein JXR77_12430, partial [Lentisphaeria bacterium]|nr:hypothetical protein [Lentisphaeria bacterium]